MSGTGILPVNHGQDAHATNLFGNLLREEVMMTGRLMSIRCALFACVFFAPASYAGAPVQEVFGAAEQNGRLANEGFRRCRLFVDGWLAHADAKTGLIPRNLTQSRDIWNAQDAAADNYPFMVLTAAITDRVLFEGRMLDMLRAETKLTSRIGAMPDTYSFSRQGFADDQPEIGRIIFGSAEYMKDGLMPLTEWLGPSPWSHRMLAILDAAWEHAPIETPYGRIVSDNVEVGGDMLQTLSRMYWFTGDTKYLDWAIRLGDYYLLGDRHPTGAGRTEPQGQWLLLECAEPAKISEVRIAWIYGDRRVYRFKIETSADGKAFHEVFKGASGGRTNEPEAYAFSPVVAKVIRITGFGSNENDFTNIAELAVHRSDGAQCDVKVAGASDFQSPNAPANAADGDMGTRWSVAGVGGGPARLRLRDHGCEIVSGLCELYAAVHFARPEKKAAYREPIHRMLDRILEVGRNEHGLLYNWIDPATGLHDANPCDTWGYNFNGFYTVYLIDGDEAYREATLKALGCLNEHYRNYPWEGASSDGHADSIESALNLYNREPVASAAAWIDHDIQVMWAIQKDDGVIEGWHGDGNFARTTIMYCLWKTQGVTVRPWRKDVIFGAELRDDGLYLVLSADESWQGVLLFDTPRHKTIMKMPLDWPRINQFPQWFTVDGGESYTIENVDAESSRTYSGGQMQKGVEVQLKAEAPLRLKIRRS